MISPYRILPLSVGHRTLEIRKTTISIGNRTLLGMGHGLETLNQELDKVRVESLFAQSVTGKLQGNLVISRC